MKLDFSQEAIEEIAQLAKVYVNQNRPNATQYVKKRASDAFIEGYKLGLQHALTVAAEEMK